MQQGRVVLRDGRRVAWAQFGAADGVAVLNCHGSPSSRLECYLNDDELARLEVRLVGVDRPGSGGSDPLPGRRVVDRPADAEQVLDAQPGSPSCGRSRRARSACSPTCGCGSGHPTARSSLGRGCDGCWARRSPEGLRQDWRPAAYGRALLLRAPGAPAGPGAPARAAVARRPRPAGAAERGAGTGARAAGGVPARAARRRTPAGLRRRGTRARRPGRVTSRAGPEQGRQAPWKVSPSHSRRGRSR